MIRFFNTFEPVADFYRDLVPALARSGTPVQVVTSSARYRSARDALESVIGSSTIVRIPAGVRTAETRARKVQATLTYALGASMRSLFSRDGSVNVFLTAPPLFSSWGRVLRRSRRQPYCCVVMDLYPHVLAAAGALPPTSLAYRLMHRLVVTTMASADRVFVIGRCAQERLIAEGVPPDRLVCVPNWANEQLIQPVQRSENSLRARFAPKDEFVVLYSGNMGVGHMFETVLACAGKLRRRTDIRFVFLGSGTRRPSVEDARRGNRLDNVVVDDLVPTDLMGDSQSLGDVHFVCLRPEFTGLLVPSKAYSALAAGRPLLYEGEATGEVARMMTEEAIGEVVTPGDVDRMTEVIESMADDRPRCDAMGLRARSLAEGKYSRLASVASYVRELTALSDTATSVGTT